MAVAEQEARRATQKPRRREQDAATALLASVALAHGTRHRQAHDGGRPGHNTAKGHTTTASYRVAALTAAAGARVALLTVLHGVFRHLGDEFLRCERYQTHPVRHKGSSSDDEGREGRKSAQRGERSSGKEACERALHVNSRRALRARQKTAERGKERSKEEEERKKKNRCRSSSPLPFLTRGGRWPRGQTCSGSAQ